MSRRWSSMVEAVSILLDPLATTFPNQTSALALVLVCSRKVAHRPRVCQVSSSNNIILIFRPWVEVLVVLVLVCIISCIQQEVIMWRKDNIYNKIKIIASMGRMGPYSPNKASLPSLTAAAAALTATIKHRHSSSYLERRVRVAILSMGLLITKLQLHLVLRLVVVMGIIYSNMVHKKCRKVIWLLDSNSSGWHLM